MSLFHRFLCWMTPSPATQWDLAANVYYIDGFSDAEIVLILGPRPKEV